MSDSRYAHRTNNNAMIMYGDLGRDKAPTEQDLRAAHDKYWLSLARACHDSSTDFLDANIRAKWEKNLAHFNSEHAKDSKFYSQNYKNRNRLFRPKTRAISLRAEAALTRALFATQDLTSVRAQDEEDPAALVSAELNQNLLQYRLEKTIPWFQTAIGAYQDTYNYGICISYQYWCYEEEEYEVPTNAMDQDGEESYRTEYDILEDKPVIDLIEPENFRFDQSADWRNVVDTSPFIERIIPMTVEMVESRMDMAEGKTGRKKWKKYTRQQILAASRGWDEEESIRMAREGRGNLDPHDKRGLPREYENVYVREYFVREGGIDWTYFTIGDYLLLTDPVPIEEVYFHGRRPFRIGFSTIEAHKAIPAGKNEIIAPIQEAINKLTNQRFDNVDQVLNKRYFMRRGQNIDTAALMRNVPGGGVYMDDPENDIKVVNTPDVTSSSYEEHNRLSSEMDEVAGNFSTATQRPNEATRNTLGGQQLERATSDELTEYSILIFLVTWVEPVLEQLLLLEQAYESDQVIMKLAAKKSKMYKKFNLQGDVPEQLLNQSLELRVDVGIGNTDPVTRQDNFVKAIAYAIQYVPGAAARIEPDEALKEIFGGAGRRDYGRFFKPADEVEQQIDPQTQALMEQNALKREELQQNGMLKMIELDQQDDQFYAGLALEKDLKLEDVYATLGIATQKEEAAMARTRLQEASKMMQQINNQKELAFKRETGQPGI